MPYGSEFVAAAAVAASYAAAAAPYVAAASAVATAGLTIASAQQQASASRQQSQDLAMQAQAQRVQADQQRVAAQQNQINASVELLKGREQANQVNAQLAAVLASQTARYGAGGVALGEGGTVETVGQASQAEADRQLTITRGNAAMKADQIRVGGSQNVISATLLDGRAALTERNSARLLSTADYQETAGYLQAGTSLFGSYDRWAARQPGTVKSTGTKPAPADSGSAESWGNLY